MAGKGTKCKIYTKSKPGSLDSSGVLVTELKEKTDNNNIKLPQYISFILEEHSTILLYIQEQIADNGKILNALSKNMQGDNAAFEGWAIVLKAWCPDKASKVRLKWDVPSQMTSKEKSHYNRFCYRVVKMLDAYEWFSIDETNKVDIEIFKKELKDLQNNCGNNKPEKKFKTGGALGENAVEYDMVHEQDFPNKMCEKYDVECINHQLPVGVKKNGESFFAGSKAAIDLWGMRGNELTIIELKYENKMVGIISELFFYVNIIRDMILGNIDKPTAILSYEKELYMRIKSMKKIHARMLADIYHPLIEKKEVFEILDNSTYKDIPIDYKKDIFKYTPSSLEFV